MSEQIIPVRGVDHPVKFAEISTPNSEYSIRPYKFTDEFGKKADGCRFEIKPHGSTRPMRIVDSRLVALRIAVKGSGSFVGFSPEGKTVVQEIGPDQKENPLIELKKGWVECFIASEEGLEVIDVSSPPFEPQMEEEVRQDLRDITRGGMHNFWRSYNECKYKDKQFNFDRDNYYDVWQIEGLSPRMQALFIFNRLRDEEVKHFYPEMYEAFVKQGPRREGLTNYKPNDMNELDYGFWLDDHYGDENDSRTKEKPLTNPESLWSKAVSFVETGKAIDEARFREIVSEYAAGLKTPQ